MMQILLFSFAKSIPAFQKDKNLLTTTVTTMMMSTTSAVRNSAPIVNPILSGTEALALSKLPNVKFLDGSWHLNKQIRNATEEYLNSHIPNAKFFDIDFISNKSTSLPHMLPSADEFSSHVSAMGISSNDHVIIYAKPDSFSAPRVWWTFRVFGHEKVSIINGGLKAWIDSNGPIESSTSTSASTSSSETCVNNTPAGDFKAKLNEKMIVNWHDVLKVVHTGSSQILDARSSARFLGQVPEARAGVKGGHIPGSLNLPFTQLVRENDVTFFKPKNEIRTAFEDAGMVVGSRAITSCGSGVSAAVLSLGHYLLYNNLENMPIYDGSWSEWGSRDDLPIINPNIANTKK